MVTPIRKQKPMKISVSESHQEIAYSSSLNVKPCLEQESFNLMDKHNSTYIPRLAKKLTQHLLEAKGSDLHLTPDDGKYHVFLRKNGLLERLLSVGEETGLELTNHWKVLANLDLTLKGKPQDGAILNSKTEAASFRVSTCPTLFGEKVVLRLHSSSVNAISIKHLGMSLQQQKDYLKAIRSSSGLILVAGPTGSGKTNTLYAALHHLEKKPLNIVSIEDPVEVNLPGITQINVNKEFGFPQALRTVLRQDPNVLMIGEIRDQETAEMAISAAQTGHLVLASIHASSSYGALLRLQDLGIDLKHAVEQLKMLISQQLVRIISDQLNSDNAAIPNYQSRQGVFEVLTCDSVIKEKLLKSTNQEKFRRALQDCINSLDETSDSALLQLIRENKTDWTEVQRVYGWEKVADLSARVTSLSGL